MSRRYKTANIPGARLHARFSMVVSPKLNETCAPVGAVEERQKRVGLRSIGFIPQLEAIRGVGALMVAAGHVSQSYTTFDLRLWNDPRSLSDPLSNALFAFLRNIGNARGAVTLFFVLSGFVLASSIKRGPARIWPAARHFFTSRIFRLYPAIIFTVVLFSLLYWFTGSFLPGGTVAKFQLVDIVRNMLLIRANIDGVMWTLQVEVLAIPLIFAITIGQERFGGKFTLVMAVLFLTLSVCRPYRHLVVHGGFVTFLYAFVFGVGIHLVGPSLWRRMAGSRLPWVVAGMLLLFCLPRTYLGFMSRWARFSECVAAVGLISVLVYGPPTTGLARVLSWPLLRFYGRISYSFYLLHPLTLLVVWAIPAPLSRLLDAGVPAVVVWLGLTIASIVAITPLAWLSWRFIEIPGIAAGRRLSPERRNASPYVGPHGRVVHGALNPK